ncbi:MAG: DUF4446 family protein [Patescibacteria group bacterium]|nr:DUF4446 family protein [Patescibacteria group bacterium]
MLDTTPLIAGGIIITVIMGWLIFLTIKLQGLRKKGEIIFSDKDPEKISKLIERYFESIKVVDKNNKKLERTLKETKELAELSVNKVALLRYNPFGDVGSDQSFSLCLLNSHEDGFVISSIHSREGTRVYSKSVQGGVSRYNLSREEERAIRLAIGKDKKDK